MRIQKDWNYRVLGLEGAEKRRRLRLGREDRVGAPAIHRARAFQAALNGGRRSYGELATEFGVTRAAVCQYLAIVDRLPMDALRALEGERDPARLRKASMKALVRIARIRDEDAQRAALDALFTSQIAGLGNNGRREETCVRKMES